MLTNAATVQTIAIAHQQLLSVLEVNSAVTRVEIDPDAEVDLTLVQLLESGRASAAGCGGALVLAAPAAGALADILHRGGFLQTADQRAFWLLETGDI